MQRRACQLYEDMLRCGLRIQKLVQNVSVEQFLADQDVLELVSYNFIIIGEALSQLQNLNPEASEQLSEWRRIVGFRNQLVHGYALIDDEITWNIIQDKLPILVDELRQIIAR